MAAEDSSAFSLELLGVFKIIRHAGARELHSPDSRPRIK